MKAMVTGGGGYLGCHLAKALLDRGDEVWIVGRNRYPRVEAWGARGLVCDLADPGAVHLLAPAMEGIDVVFHTAALPPYHAPREVFVRTNVHGTERVIEACRRAGVPRLVNTSTPSVTADGRDHENATEADLPIAAHPETPYAETKAIAERAVSSANGADLATVSLRPHLIYGPEEPHMLPRLRARHQAGRLRIIGDGTNRVGLTYLDNAVAAHLAAADALTGPDADCAGRAYFITDAEPVVLWTWIDQFLTGVGDKPLRKTIPLATAHRIGGVMETLWSTLPLPGEPPMTRFVATQLATSHWYDLSGAYNDLGYAPTVDGVEGLSRTIAWFHDHGEA